MGRYGCKFSGYFHLHDLGLASHPAVHKKTYLGLRIQCRDSGRAPRPVPIPVREYKRNFYGSYPNGNTVRHFSSSLSYPLWYIKALTGHTTL